MKELNGMVEKALSDMHSSGKLEQIITSKVESVITSAIDDSLRSYSDFGKSLSEHIKSALNVNFEMLSFESYNRLILDIVQRMLDARLEEATTKRLEEDLQTLLADPPKEVKLSELIKQFIDEETEQANEDGYGEISFVHVDDGNFQYVAWDREPGKERYSCGYQIGFHDGKPFSFKIDDNNPEDKMFMGKLYAFDRLMFQIYAAGTDVILDIDSVETEYPRREY